MDERESTAIRRYAPRFNTSIPSQAKSLMRMPDVVGVAAVFQDQAGPCGAFLAENLRRQEDAASVNPAPPWKRKRTRRKTVKREVPIPAGPVTPVEWTREDSARLVRAYGVSLSEPLHYKVNLCDDGSVVTRDGECIGAWEMDEHAFPAFVPEGASEPLFRRALMGLLCLDIEQWHEARTGEAIG
jgi:hypothetical protein